MIIYENTKGGFIRDIDTCYIEDIIENAFREHNVPHSNDSERRAWKYSLMHLGAALRDYEIDDECKLAIEYQIPLTAKRVDFLIAGQDNEGNNNVVIIELKQWEDCTPTNNDELVIAYTGRANRLVCHPSYQAYSYAKIIETFNEEVYKNNISIIPCAYLHNFLEINRNNIDNERYKNAIDLAPLFLKYDKEKLNCFIKKYIRKKDDIDLLYKIENGRLKPAKSLQDSLYSMMKGNKEFYLIDEQKVAFETVKSLVKDKLKNNINKKHTIIIQGGPGTGKSVIAIKLLVELINNNYSANYVTKNKAPREVYFKKLRGKDFKKKYLENLFKGSGSYIDCSSNTFDCLIVDEAHRLNAKSGMYQNLGENQIKEIINASRISVFLIDESQKVTTKDVGSIDLINQYANQFNSEIHMGEELVLKSQFRCNGSDGYLAFLDNLLEIRETANHLFDFDYEIKLYNSPSRMREDLKEKNKINNKTRMIAGYCYNWITKKDASEGLYDILLEDDFKAKWNLNNTSTWAIDEESFDQVGCIHTSQGLEFDYVGVIIGNDLRYENNKVITDFTKRAKTDTSLKGIKSSKNFDLADEIIRNTYRTLLSRGQKGCYIYCEDKALLKHMSDMLNIEIIE